MKAFILSSVLFFSIGALNSSVHASEPDKTEANQPCLFESTDNDRSMIEIRRKTHSALCNAVASIDSWFGNEEKFNEEKFGGKLVVGFRQDEEKGFDPKLRIRIRSKLPNLSKKTKAFIGRTDEESYISDSAVNGVDSIKNDLKDEDTSWLIGLGYSNPSKNGFSSSLGAKISSGSLNPYIKSRYRTHKAFTDKKLIRFSQTLFLRRQEGAGTTTNAQYSYLIDKNNLFTSDFSATYRHDTEIWNSGISLTHYNKLKNKQGISYSVYARSERGGSSTADMPEYGVSLSHRRPVLHDWLVLKTSIQNRWTHENNGESRESYAKLSMQLEMKFGNYKK